MACYLRGVGDWSTLEHQGQTYSGTEVVAFTPKIVGIPFRIFFGIDVLS
jgi:hypothetical protein